MRAKAETELKEKVDKLEEKRQKAVAEAEQVLKALLRLYYGSVTALLRLY